MKEIHSPGVEGATGVHENSFQTQALKKERIGRGENLLAVLIDIKHP